MIADSIFVISIIAVWVVIARGCAYLIRERAERRKVSNLVKKYWE